MMKFYLSTSHPVAYDSPDHIEPRATARDNSVNLAFNKKLYALFSPEWRVMVLDFGCAGGGMVKSILDDGHIAVGLEGSDYSLMHQRAEWATIPDYLFTCDVTKPFTLHTGEGKPSQFDVITVWEFVEHIKEADLPGMFANMRRHLKPKGLVIGSTTKCQSIWREMDHHQTRRHYEWWVRKFEEFGFTKRADLKEHFGNDWVRKVEYQLCFEKDETWQS